MNASLLGRYSVMVIGGFGFMGSHLCRSFLNVGRRVTVFDKLYASHKLVRDIEKRITLIEGDIRKTDELLSAVDTHGQARGTLTGYKRRLTGFGGRPSLPSRDAFTHG